MKRKGTKGTNRYSNTLLLILLVSGIVTILIVILTVGIRKCLFSDAVPVVNNTRVIQNVDAEMDALGVQKFFLTRNKNSRPGTALTQVKGVVVHYTANPGTDAKENRNYFESRKNCPDKSAYKVSSHYIIGLKGNIIQCIPENEIAYASNKRNIDTISIECCHPDTTGKFNEKTYQSLVRLVSILCKKYQLETTQIIRHYDVTQKLCPKYFVENPDKWKKFKNDVQKQIIE